VAEAPAALECKTFKSIDLPGGKYEMIIGEVTGVHIRDEMLHDGRYDLTRARHVARLGYRDYAQIDDIFELSRPDD
jgi:flavin reductase (DIM6/NTAB) family NADH-FMN oxidoreductase RutF